MYHGFLKRMKSLRFTKAAVSSTWPEVTGTFLCFSFLRESGMLAGGAGRLGLGAVGVVRREYEVTDAVNYTWYIKWLSSPVVPPPCETGDSALKRVSKEIRADRAFKEKVVLLSCTLTPLNSLLECVTLWLTLQKSLCFYRKDVTASGVSLMSGLHALNTHSGPGYIMFPLTPSLGLNATAPPLVARLSLLPKVFCGQQTSGPDSQN